MRGNTESGEERLWDTIGRMEEYAREHDNERFYRALILLQRCLFLNDSKRGVIALPIILTSDRKRTHALIGVGEEDVCQPTTRGPKWEKVIGFSSKLTPITPDMVGVVSGMVSSDESHNMAIARELKEELGIAIINPQLRWFPELQLNVLQKRGGNIVKFTVHGCTVVLNKAQSQEMLRHLEEGDDRRPVRFLSRDKRYSDGKDLHLRPLAIPIVQLLRGDLWEF